LSPQGSKREAGSKNGRIFYHLNILFLLIVNSLLKLIAFTNKNYTNHFQENTSQEEAFPFFESLESIFKQSGSYFYRK
jgi:hypothetical protein